MRRGTPCLLLCVLLLLTIAIVVGACGSTKDGTSTTAAPSATAGSATTAAPTTETTAALEPIELSMASMHQPTALSGVALEEWAEKIKQATNGLLTIRHYGSSQLITGQETRTATKEGVVDIGNSFIFGADPGFEVGVNLVQLTRGKDVADGVRIFDAIWDEFPDLMASQWEGLKVLWVVPTLAVVVYTTDKPVYTMADMKGLELRVPSAIVADMITALGAVPVSMSPPDWVASLDKGTTDGGATSAASLVDYQIGGKLLYATNFAMGCSINFLIMNMDSFNKLPAEFQKVIDDSLEAARQDAIDAWAATEKLVTEYGLEKGLQFIELADDEYQRWNDMVRPVYDKMAADMDKAGYPGTKLVDFALSQAR